MGDVVRAILAAINFIQVATIEISRFTDDIVKHQGDVSIGWIILHSLMLVLVGFYGITILAPLVRIHLELPLLNDIRESFPGGRFQGLAVSLALISKPSTLLAFEAALHTQWAHSSVQQGGAREAMNPMPQRLQGRVDPRELAAFCDMYAHVRMPFDETPSGIQAETEIAKDVA